MFLFPRSQHRRRKFLVSSKYAISFVLSAFAFIVLFQESSQSLPRLLSSSQQQVDLTKFQIDTYALLDADIPKEEIIKEIHGVVPEGEDFDEEAARIPIDQMFYMNLDEDVEKRQKMETGYLGSCLIGAFLFTDCLY